MSTTKTLTPEALQRAMAAACNAGEYAGIPNRVYDALVAGWIELQVEHARALAEVRRAGAMLSNCAYNLAQREHLTDDERRSLDEARQAWDAAISAAPAPEVP